jgi:hypothetical protein
MSRSLKRLKSSASAARGFMKSSMRVSFAQFGSASAAWCLWLKFATSLRGPRNDEWTSQKKPGRTRQRGPGISKNHSLSYRLNTKASRQINFDTINQADLRALPAILARLLPGGKIVGREFIAPNPTRADRRAGSFSINLRTGRWADFATGDRGGDVMSLVAYIDGSHRPRPRGG